METRAAVCRIRRQARSPDADHRQPGQPSPARNPVRHGAEDADGKDAGDLSRRRRRLRHETVSLSRIRADLGGRARSCARPSNGPPIAPTISWATRRAATTSPPRGWRSPRTASSSAMDVDLMGDMGAYLSTFGPYIPHGGAGMLPGLYDIQTFHCRVRTVFTNTVPVDAYRGAGRPEAAYVIERLVDACRAKTRHDAGRDPAQELHSAEGDALQDRDRQGLRFRRLHRAHEARDGSRATGRSFPSAPRLRRSRAWCAASGMASYVEVCGTMGEETANVRARSQRRHHHPDRHPVERAGAPDRLCATRRRAVRGAAGTRPRRCRATPTRSPPVSAPAVRRRSRPAASASSAPPASSAAS